MADDLQRLVHTTEGEAPSAAFVADLRARVLAEAGESAMLGLRTLDLTIVPDSEVRRPAPVRRWVAIAAAAAVAVVFGVVVLRGSGGTSLETIEPAEPTTTTSASPTPDPDVTIPLLTAPSTNIEVGTFRVDTLGTEFVFTADQTLGVLRNRTARFELSHFTSREADDRILEFRRLSAWSVPDDPAAVPAWPIADVRGWLAALPDTISVSGPTETELGGVEAVGFELVPNPGACDDGCLRLGWNHGFENGDPTFLREGSTYRIWVLDQGAFEPVVALAAIDGADDVDWFDDVDRILASVEFSEPGPNPMRQPTERPVVLEAFDGIEVTPPAGVVVAELHAGVASIFPADVPGAVDLLTRPTTLDASPIRTTADLLATLAAENVVVEELGSTTVDGAPTRHFRIRSAGFVAPVLLTRTAELGDDASGWVPPQDGHLWVIEHPERGVLIVATVALEDPQITTPLIRTWAEDFLTTVRFR